MKHLITSLGLVFLFVSCETKETSNIVVTISGLDSEFALIGFSPQSNRNKEIIDTVQFIDGKLEYNYPVHELNKVIIIPFDLFFEYENGVSYPLPASRINFFIDSLDQIKIEAVISDNIVDYQATGNNLSEQLTEARKMKIPLFKERVIFEFEYNSVAAEDRNELDEEAYWKNRAFNNEKYKNQNILYIESNLDAEYASRLILELRDREKAAALYYDLSQTVQNSYFGIIAGDMIDGWAITTPGIKFPDIRANTIENQEFQLSNLRGKYVLLDFWGSWCAPCIEEMPKMIGLHNKYKDELAIVGLACKDNKIDLMETIETLQINWPQILSGTTRETNYSQKFGITGFPTKVLIDKNGEVIKTYIGIDEDLYADIDSLITL